MFEVDYNTMIENLGDNSVICGLTPYNPYDYREVISVHFAAQGTYDELRDPSLIEVARRTIKAGVRGDVDEEWVFRGREGSHIVLLEQWINDDYVAIKRVGRDDMVEWLEFWDKSHS